MDQDAAMGQDGEHERNRTAGGRTTDPDSRPAAAALEPSMPPRLTAGVVDVFVYVVVLNLFIEYVPRVLTETFTLSLLTAVLLKAVLEVVVAAKNRTKRRFRAASTRPGKLAAAGLLWLLLVGSKFVVLEAVDLVFGDRVSLGGFLSVTVLILILLLARLGVRRLLATLDPVPPAEGAAPAAQPRTVGNGGSSWR